MPGILIADDNQAMRASLRAILSREGWQLCGEAMDGRQAVDLARELKPDLIILDLAMPVLDGLHAGAEIVKADPSRPVILYTLHASEPVALAAKKAGIREVISKTAELGALFACVKNLLAGKGGPVEAAAGEASTILEKPDREGSAEAD